MSAAILTKVDPRAAVSLGKVSTDAGTIDYWIAYATRLPRLPLRTHGWHAPCVHLHRRNKHSVGASDDSRGLAQERREDMSDSTKDRIEGKSDELLGKAKEAVGNATNDTDTEAEGQAQQAEGEAKQGLAGLKDKVDDVVKKITN
jgi:uncharacterized protein YjbJ (UPF0337 family)